MLPIHEIVADAGQTDFDVPFPFVSHSHVEVRANGIRWYPTEWVGPARLRLSSPPGAGSFVQLRRNTPIDQQFVEFQNGAVLTQEDLNVAVQQLLYKQQELTALYEGTLLAARVRIGEAGGVAITPEDAANQIAALIAADQVLADFRERIHELDVSAETVLAQVLWNQGKHERAQTLIRVERTERIDGDTEVAQQVTTVAAKVDANEAAIIQEVTARADAISAEALSREALAVRVGANASAIQQQATATTDQFSAMASLWSLLGVLSGDGSAFILDDSTVKMSDGTALAHRLSGLDAAIGDNAAAIVDEAELRVSDLESVAEKLTVVNTSIEGLDSSVSELFLSTNGLNARWGIQLDVNNYISGLVMNNDGETADFTVLVDKFRIVNPVNGNILQPFVVEDGVVKITTLFAGVINADLINAGRLNVDTLIWDGDIWTSKLANNSVTRMSSTYGSANHDMRTKAAGVWEGLTLSYITGYTEVWNGTEYVTTPTYATTPAALTFTGLVYSASVKLDLTIDHYRTGSSDDQFFARIVRYRSGVEPTPIGDVFVIRSRAGYTLTTLPFIDVVPEAGDYTYTVELQRFSSHGSVIDYVNLAGVVGQK